MKRNTRIWAILLSISIIMGMTQFLYADAKLPFTDVKESDWYYKDVKNAYEKNLIAGKSKTIYDPNANMTYAEAVKLASCMHQLKKEGVITLKAGNPWYQTFVDYARKNKILSVEGDLPWNEKVTRAGYMEIFANVLSDSESAKNKIADGSIPDVAPNHPNAKAIYKLYRAGIVAGVDTQHRCNPMANIKRSEVAAILTRMTDKNRRVAFALGGSDSGNTSSGGNTNSTASSGEFKILKQPVDSSALRGNTADFAIAAQGNNVQYQWQIYEINKFVNIDDAQTDGGAKKDKLNIKVPNDAVDDMQIRCRLVDADGKELISDTAKVVINPVILKFPKDTTMLFKEELTLKAEALGKDLSYQWQLKNGNDYENIVDMPGEVMGAKSDSLNIKAPNKPTTITLNCEIKDEYGRICKGEDFKVKVIPDEYIHRLLLISSTDFDSINNKADSLENEGYIAIRKDLNKGANGEYIYLLYKTIENTEFAVKDIFIEKYDAVNPSEGEIIKEHYGENVFLKDKINLNAGTSGEVLYLFRTTKEGEYRYPVYAIDVHIGKNPEAEYPGWEVVKFRDSDVNADLNKGAGGEYIYLVMKRNFD